MPPRPPNLHTANPKNAHDIGTEPRPAKENRKTTKTHTLCQRPNQTSLHREAQTKSGQGKAQKSHPKETPPSSSTPETPPPWQRRTGRGEEKQRRTHGGDAHNPENEQIGDAESARASTRTRSATEEGRRPEQARRDPATSRTAAEAEAGTPRDQGRWKRHRKRERGSKRKGSGEGVAAARSGGAAATQGN